MSSQPKLPIITFNKQTLNQTSDDWLLTCYAVKQALENYGCFVVYTDEISSGLHNTMFGHVKDLFRLPIETKMKNTSDIFGFGFGKYSSLPLYECMGMEINNSTIIEATRSFTNLLFPSGNTAFRETVVEYTKSLSEIHHCVMRMVFDSYGIEDKQLEHSSFYIARFMKYRTPNEDEREIGLLPHKDKTFLGVLDDNGVKGLDVRMKNGEWIHHESLPSTFVVIAGELLMAWSNGRIYAPLHQVAMRMSEKDVVRYVTALFSFSRETIEVPEKLVDDKHYLRYRPFNNLDYLKYVTTEEGKISKDPIESYCGVTNGTVIDNGN